MSFAGIHCVPLRRKLNCVASFFLSAVLLAPERALARPVPKDDRERHEPEERERKVYDPVHNDYHNWDGREDEAYHRWLETKHES